MCKIKNIGIRPKPKKGEPRKPAQPLTILRLHQLRRDRAEAHYIDTLLALKAAFFPEREHGPCCVGYVIGACRHGEPCACGKLNPAWPWIVHDPNGDLCACFQAAARLAWESAHEPVCAGGGWKGSRGGKIQRDRLLFIQKHELFLKHTTEL